MGLLEGKRGLVVGIANEHSIAAGCAMAFRAAGAELAVTYGHEKSKPFIAPVVAKLDAPLFLPLDVEVDGQMEAVFKAIDFLNGVNSILFCIPSHIAQRTIYMGPSANAPKKAFRRPWTSLSTL